MKSPYKFIIVIFSIIAAFGIGFLTNQYIINRNQVQLVSSVETDSVSGEYINSILDILNSEYLNTIPTEGKLTYGAVKGLVNALGDKYTSFLSPDEAKDYFTAANNEFEGIGVTLASDKEKQYTTIETVLPGYPAEKAGVLPGDIIVKVGETDAQAKEPSEVATLIRGKAGTEVKLTLFREKDGASSVITVAREKIDLQNMEWKMLDNGVALISIYKFSEDTVANFNRNWDKLVNDVRANSPKSVIIDMRNNPGGYVDSVKYVAEEFLKTDQVIFMEETKTGRQLVAVDSRTGSFENLPLTVIVNEGSASAAEILSAAIQDNNRGEIVGQKTVGKGVEQKLINLRDGSLLVMVFRKWLTPAGRNISEETPITPNHIVQDDLAKSGDEQLDKALSLVQTN
jgi:carboxyl-terminal processing protease